MWGLCSGGKGNLDQDVVFDLALRAGQDCAVIGDFVESRVDVDVILQRVVRVFGFEEFSCENFEEFALIELSFVLLLQAVQTKRVPISEAHFFVCLESALEAVCVPRACAKKTVLVAETADEIGRAHV